MTRILASLLSVCQLLLAATPLSAEIASARRWKPHMSNSLRVAQSPTPGRPLRCKAMGLDGHVIQGDLLAVELVADSLYQPRLARWIAADPARAVLPPLGQELRLAERYEAGRRIRGAFLGFNGPYVVMRGADGRLQQNEWGRGLEGAAGSLRLDGRRLDQQRDWPPSRLVYFVRGPDGRVALSPDELRDLRITQKATLGTVLVLPLFLGLVLLCGYASGGMHFNGIGPL